MYNIEESSEIFRKIYTDSNAEKYILEYIDKNKILLKLFFKMCKKGRWEATLKLTPMMKLSLVYLYLPYAHNEFIKMNIDEKIFYDTMDDIRIWIDDYRNHSGKYGLDELNWIMNHMTLKMFKLGRLQFQPIKYYYPKAYKTSNRTVKAGCNAINVHIPRGDKLDMEACLESFNQAEIFFKKHFPKYPTDFFVCHSWLIYSKNKLFMNKNSNILKFASLFDIVDECENPSQAYRWLFGVHINGVKENLHRKKYGSYNLPLLKGQKNKLQEAAIEYIKNGGTLGDAMAALETQKLKEMDIK